MTEAGPVLCKWCLSQLALAGLNIPYCEVCDRGLHPGRWAGKMFETADEWVKGKQEMADQRDFEHDHRWGADVPTLRLGRWFAEFEEEDWPEGDMGVTK